MSKGTDFLATYPAPSEPKNDVWDDERASRRALAMWQDILDTQVELPLSSTVPAMYRIERKLYMSRIAPPPVRQSRRVWTPRVSGEQWVEHQRTMMEINQRNRGAG